MPRGSFYPLGTGWGSVRASKSGFITGHIQCLWRSFSKGLSLSLPPVASVKTPISASLSQFCPTQRRQVLSRQDKAVERVCLVFGLLIQNDVPVLGSTIQNG